MAIKLKQNEQVLIGIFAILAPVIIGWFVILEPQYNGIQKTMKKKNEAQTTLATNQGELATAKDRQQRIQAQDFTEKVIPDLLNRSEESAITEQINKTLDLIAQTNNSIIEVRPLGYQKTDVSTMGAVAPPATGGTTTPPAGTTPPPAGTEAPAPAGAPPAAAPPTGEAVPVTPLAQFILEVPCVYTIRGTFGSINELVKGIINDNCIIEIFELQIAPDVGEGGSLNYIDPTKPLKARIGLIYPIKTVSWSEQSKDSFQSNAASPPTEIPASTETPGIVTTVGATKESKEPKQ